ncbi:hypothetical protein C8Q77DRAFT_1209724 [Trametes polyzona]|nr:hypothetical protein C8Q77DRAFT_1209724 [Trametes polyzona]
MSLLQLPCELSARVLGELDAQDLLACKRASPWVDHFIANSPSLQYKIELALAGRRDGLSPTIPLSERLEAIQAYRAAWNTGEHPVNQVIRRRSVYESGEVLFSTVSEPKALKVYSTQASFCGVEERAYIWGCNDLRRFLDAGRPTLDLSERLAVTSTAMLRIPILQPMCSFEALEDNFPTHPLAGRDSLYGCIDRSRLPGSSGSNCFQILGDLIAWNVPGHRSEPLIDRIVYNWKTDVKLWHAHLPWMHRLYLLSSKRFLVVDTDALVVRLYTLDPGSLADVGQPLPLDTGCLSVLQLPTMAKGLPHPAKVESTFRLPAALEPAAVANSLFLHDPSLAVLSLHFDFGGPGEDEVDEPYIYHEREYGWASESLDELTPKERHTLVIPVHSILNASDIARAAHPDTPPSVPWEAWGRSGTRMIRPPPRSNRRPCSVLNCQLAFRQWDQAERLCKVTIFEAFPLADQVDVGAELLLEPLRADEEVSGDSPYWTNLGHTTYPVRRTRRDIKLRSGLIEKRTVQTLLSHDGLVFSHD